MDYVFAIGDRVTDGLLTGTVTMTVPGNGIGWYYVTWDDGSEDRYTADSLSKSY